MHNICSLFSLLFDFWLGSKQKKLGEALKSGYSIAPVPVGIWCVDSCDTEIRAGDQKCSKNWKDGQQSKYPVDDGHSSSLGLCAVDDQSSC